MSAERIRELQAEMKQASDDTVDEFRALLRALMEKAAEVAELPSGSIHAGTQGEIAKTALTVKVHLSAIEQIVHMNRKNR